MYLQQKIEIINQKLAVLAGLSNVIVWGAGEHTRALMEKTDLSKYHIMGIVDMDRNKLGGGTYFGFVIQEPKQIDWHCVEAVVVSASAKEQEITELLTDSFGVDIKKIITFYGAGERMPFYRLYEENGTRIAFNGDYADWEEAVADCGDWQSMLEGDIDAVNKVLRGEGAWVQDAQLFYEPKYNYCLCGAILRCALQKKDRQVRVLDIGGALGNSWFQNLAYFADAVKMEYIIAEQDNYAEYGHRNLERDGLKFIKSIDDWQRGERFDLILLSGSLEYIDRYQEFLDRIVQANPRYIMLDRLAVGDRARICKQTVPPTHNAKGSYAFRIFSEEEVMRFFGEGYELIEKDRATTPGRIFFEDGKADYRYYVFRNISA